MAAPRDAAQPAPDGAVERSFPRPTPRVAVVLAVAALATVAAHLATPLVAAIVVATVTATVVDGVAARRAPAAFEVVAPATLARRSSAPLEVRCTSSAHVARLTQPLGPALLASSTETAGASLLTTVTGVDRGTHELRGPVARVLGPLGLASVDVASTVSRSIQVLPDLPGARREAMRRRGSVRDAGAAVRRRGLGTEFDSIRDYDPGDDVRFVNWMATSRSGRPMTNQFRVDENRDLVCLLDAGRLMCAPAGSATRLDVALDAMCVLGVAADDAGDRVGATAFSDRVLRLVEPSRRGTAAVVEACFDLQAVEVESDFLLAFQQVAGRKRSIVAVFSDLVDPAAARTILEAIPILVRRHEVLLVRCVDEDLARVAVAAPRDYDDVLRAAVALGLLDAHRDVVRHATALGAQVVEAPPPVLGTACAAAYVRLKALARV